MNKTLVANWIGESISSSWDEKQKREESSDSV